MLCETERNYFGDPSLCSVDPTHKWCPTSYKFEYPCANYLSFFTGDTDQKRCPTSAYYVAECDYITDPANTYPNAVCPLDVPGARMLRHIGQ
jgi:hypothetical protein